jgi:hypothetical protein
MRTSHLLLLSLIIGTAAATLTACGGGNPSSMQTAPLAPQFTSTPVTAATQSMAYSYQLAATDPSGGTVTFALTTAPAGATLSSNTVSWTPSAAESRVSNSFTVTATTTSGGSATQSWTVTPNGTITVNWVDTNWTVNGPVQVPISGAAGLFALVPQSDGSFLALQGSFVSPGVVNILNVPAGHFWLAQGPLPSSSIWTSSSTIDLGQDQLGAPIPGSAGQSTTFNFNLAGLTSVPSPGWLEALTDTHEGLGAFTVPADSTTLTANVSFPEGPDWSEIDTVFLMQYEPASLGSFSNLVLGPELTLSNLALTTGTNNIVGTLQASPQTSINVNVPGTQWIAPLGSVGPAAATPRGSYLSVTAEPYISGRSATPGLFGPDFGLVIPAQPALPPLGSDWCLNGSILPFGILPVNGPPVVSDTNFGALQYGDPFPSAWTRAVSFCQQAYVPITIPGISSQLLFGLLSGEAVPPSSSLAPLAPLAGPVQNATVNGSSFFTAATLNTAAVTLSWSAPTGTAPYGYLIFPIVVEPNGGGVGLGSGGGFRTATTSVALPPLTPGNTYLFLITTLVDGAANVETSPYRSALPTAFAQVVSAPITIASGATVPSIQGDAKVLQQLLQSKAKNSGRDTPSTLKFPPAAIRWFP